MNINLKTHSYTVDFKVKCNFHFIGELYMSDYAKEKIVSLDEALDISISKFEQYKDKNFHLVISYVTPYSDKDILLLGKSEIELPNSKKGIHTFYDNYNDIWQFSDEDLSKINLYNEKIYNHNLQVDIMSII